MDFIHSSMKKALVNQKVHTPTVILQYPIVLLQSDEWRRQRHRISPAFTNRKLKLVRVPTVPRALSLYPL